MLLSGRASDVETVFGACTSLVGKVRSSACSEAAAASPNGSVVVLITLQSSAHAHTVLGLICGRTMSRLISKDHYHSMRLPSPPRLETYFGDLISSHSIACESVKWTYP